MSLTSCTSSFLSYHESEKIHVSDLLWLRPVLIVRSTRLLVHQTIATLDQFLQPLGETCRRSAIDNSVIKADRQAQVFPDRDLPVNDPRLLANTTHYNSECWFGCRDAPACTLPKHAHCRDAHRPPVFLPLLGIPSPYPGEDPEERSKEKGRQGL